MRKKAIVVGHVAKNNYLCSMKQEKKRTSIGLNKENKRKVYLKASDFMLDLAKLVFGGIILTGIMDAAVDKIVLFSVGGVVTLILCAFGYSF